jgi:ATP-dependent protease ClpP protease subunit|tara:strand:+ start:1874 stop:2434 length:561 start_codon:yes stop_codon:yes gene_type:complete
MNINEQNGFKTYTATPIGYLYEFYLSGPVGNSEEYVGWFETIRKATKEDVIKIYINSEGGNMDTALQFTRVLQESQAYIIASVEGCCMSAATIILLCANSYEISSNSMFMFHNYSGGVVGKGGEMYDNVMYERKWSEGFLNEVYVNFLDEAEIQSMLDNKDIWLTSREVSERLNNLADINEKESIE